MVSGLLTGKMTAERVAALPQDDWRRRAVEFNEPRLSRNLRLVELLREIGREHGVEPGVVAVAWTLHHPAITAAITGVAQRAAGGRHCASAELPADGRAVQADQCFPGRQSSMRLKKTASRQSPLSSDAGRRAELKNPGNLPGFFA